MNRLYKLLTRKSTIGNDVIICICAVLVGYFYYYENYNRFSSIENPERINLYIKIFISIIIIFTWLIISLENGIKRRKSFMIFTACIWIIPQIIQYLLEILNPGTFSSELLAKIFLLTKHLTSIFNLSLQVFGDIIYEYTNIPYIVTLNCLVMCYIIMFIIGMIINKYYTHDIGDNDDVKLNKTSKGNFTTT